MRVGSISVICWKLKPQSFTIMELESVVNSEDDSLVTPLHDESRDPDAPAGTSGGGEPIQVPQSPKKSSCASKCVNGNLVALKALLFIFYGGET